MMERQAQSKPAAIASAPPGVASTTLNGDGEGSPQATMPFTCLTCAKRKIKCDKLIPTCSSCRKSKFECTYQAPPPRRRKRKLSGEGNEKLAQYERILSQNGLLPPEDANANDTPGDEPRSVVRHPLYADHSKPGKFVAGEGKSRYVDSVLWKSLGEDDVQHISDDDDDGEGGHAVPHAPGFATDPLTGALSGAPQNLYHFHPTHEEAMALWKTHTDHVEPLCKILHKPSTGEMVRAVSREPTLASKTDECLLFAIYHFAVVSMATDECMLRFAQSRDTLIQRYHFAARQALINASFLKTTEFSILQALTLFLLACRHFYDANTYWILTGCLTRIAQRMGLHRNPETLGLPPFEIQMRRRLLFQIIPLDGLASQMAGVDMAFIPEAWDLTPPLNIDDDRIWPGMTDAPVEQQGATEMMFCLVRACVGSFVARGGTWEQYPIVEKEIEERFIRYCDVINPLHFLSISIARSAIGSMRLRGRLNKEKNATLSQQDIAELLDLAQKILDTDSAAYANLGLRKFRWHVNGFFAWGSWDSLIFILTNLRKANVFSPAQSDSAWTRLQEIYTNHPELLEAKRAVQIAMGRLTLRAWKSSPPSFSLPEPMFIKNLRSSPKVNPNVRAQDQRTPGSGLHTMTTDPGSGPSCSMFGPSPTNDASALFASLSSDFNWDLDSNFNLDTADWLFWDQLIKDSQQQAGYMQ